jgi:hypothetical protein
MVFTLRDSLSNISFCDKQCSNLNNNKAKEDLINYFEKKYPIKIIDRGYIPLNPHMMRNISYHQHILTTLTNGNSYILFLTQVEGINCCFYIDRKLKGGYTFPKIHCVKYRFANELFEKETIFSGELIRDNDRKWFFVLSDILVYKGQDTKSKNILSKFEMMYDILKEEYTADEHMEVCPLQIKKLFTYDQVDTLVQDFIPNLSYVCKGLLFNTLDSKFNNYALILPRERQLQVVDKSYIDSIIERKNPELMQNVMPVMDYSNNLNAQDKYIDNKSKYNIVAPESAGIVANQSITEVSDRGPYISNNYDNRTNNSRTNNSRTNNNRTNNNGTNNNGTNNNGTNNNRTNYYQSNSVMTATTLESSNHTKSNITQNNVVFRILKTESPDIYNLYCLNGDELIKDSIALIPNIKISQKMYHLFKNNNKLDVNMECKFSNVFERWIPENIVTNTPYSSHQIESIRSTLTV